MSLRVHQLCSDQNDLDGSSQLVACIFPLNKTPSTRFFRKITVSHVTISITGGESAEVQFEDRTSAVLFSKIVSLDIIKSLKTSSS
jgi:hypothetical protein